MSGTEHLRACGARRKYDGGPCQQPAIRGSTRCRMHGGGAPQVRKAAAQRVTEAATLEVARQYGKPRTIDAGDALQEELHRTQGHVDWLNDQVSNHPHDPGWLAVYQSERAHLAKLSSQIITSNVAERRTVLAEQSVDALEVAMTGILHDLGLDPHDGYVRGVVAKHLREAITGAGESTATVDADDGANYRPDNVRPLPVAF